MRRAAISFLIACALLIVFPTSWLIEPHRMFIAESESESGRGRVRFERDVAFPVYLRVDSAFLAAAGGDRYCEARFFIWVLPEEAGEGRAAPRPPRCVEPPPPGYYHISTEWRLCLWRVCAQPERFVSDPVHVTAAGRYRAARKGPA